MRIKSICIINFAGLKNKMIEFKEGFNLVYGENESGKSSIEKFIRIWLYGIKEELEDRKKYLPLIGEKISGQLVVEYDGREIIIDRIFGLDNKDDICEVIDASTGKKIKVKHLKEPGKSLLNISYSSYMKSLNIGQVHKNTFDFLYENNKYDKSELNDNKKNKLPSIEVLETMEYECVKYRELLSLRNRKINDLEELKKINDEFNKDISLYKNIDSMGDNLLDRIYKLKNDQQEIEQEINKYKINYEFINKTKRELIKQDANIDCIEFIGKYRGEIENLLQSYKDGLKDLKYRLENQSKHKIDRNTKDINRKILLTNIELVVLCILFLLSVVMKYIPGSILCIVLFVFLIKRYFKYSLIIRKNKIAKKDIDLIQKAKKRVEDEEEEINIYIKETNCNSYEEFIEKLTKYDKYISYKHNYELVLKEKEAEFNEERINTLQHLFKENQDILKLFYDTLSCSNIDELLERIERYEKLKKDRFNIHKTIEETKKYLINIEINIKEIEKSLLDKKVVIEAEDFSIDNLIIKLKDLKKKVLLEESYDHIKLFIGDELNGKVLKRLNRLSSMKFDKIKIENGSGIEIYSCDRFYDLNKLSSSTINQIYLALSLSFSEMFFKNKNVPLLLDDTFAQYDDSKRKKALRLLVEENFKQIIFFTSQINDKNILDYINPYYEYIEI